jgi:hypothetical protein
MSATQTPADGDPEAGRYEIRLEGHLDARWGSWFDGLGLTHEGDGTTVIQGPVPDQAALHGLLSRVRDLALPLISVRRVGPAGFDPPDAGPHELLTKSRKEQER